MKNLLVYINPVKRFDKEKSILAKIQIDNSLRLGWKPEDIIIVTNFPFEHNGVKSLFLDVSNFCEFRPLSTKTVVVANMLAKGLIEPDQIYWVHDFDAFQLVPFDNIDIKDVGFTTYGWSAKWCLGSYFLKSSSVDIFKLLKDKIYELKIEDERALVALTRKNINKINERIKILNITYQVGMRHLLLNYEQAIKPLKVIHFHPFDRGRQVLESFMYGENELGQPLMTIELIDIFKKYGIQ